jgi:hypothetical protein
MDKRKRDLYLRILRCALLNIRHLGNRGKAADCALEAHHVHNVPELLATEDPGKERYYWDVERKIYLERLGKVDPNERVSFESLWEEMVRLDEMPNAYTIYIPLLSRDALHPTTGLKIDDQIYEVLPTKDYDPANESWEFPPGSVVECEPRMDAFPVILVATRRVR